MNFGIKISPPLMCSFPCLRSIASIVVWSMWLPFLTPRVCKTVVPTRWIDFRLESQFLHPMFTSCNLNFASVLPLFFLSNLCSAGNLEPRFGNHGLQTLGYSGNKKASESLHLRRVIVMMAVLLDDPMHVSP